MSDFMIHDLSERKYFSMIPYILHEIGLDVYEISVYCAIKRSGGEEGDCTKSKNTLAKQSGNISTRKLVQVIQSLCEVNKFLKKPLIICQKRDHEYGDSDTNLIKIVDIWIENTALCRENEKKKTNMTPGGAQHAPPHAQYSPQGVHAMQGGGAQHAPKEEPFKKNPIKKTTTPTSSSDVHKSKVEVDVVSIAEKEAAIAFKEWIDKEATKSRRRKEGHSRVDVQWGQRWNIPLATYEKLIKVYGIAYVQEQLSLMVEHQKDFDEGIGKEVVKPETFLKLACEKNYAGSDKKKE